MDQKPPKELSILAYHISFKMAELKISLEALTKKANVEMSTLRKVVNQEPNFSPKFNFIANIAKFFKCQPIDLLVKQHLPYYIPIIDINHALDFINNNNKNIELYPQLKTNGLYNSESFAIKSQYEIFGEKSTVYFCCQLQTTIKVSVIHLVIINSTLMLIKIINIKNDQIEYRAINNITYCVAFKLCKIIAVISQLISDNNHYEIN